ncbi:MAG: hypothetical protein ACI4I6_09495 [Hominimerdicola sp.]
MIQKISINHNGNVVDVESIMSLSVVKEVNSETSVMPGCATASMLTVEIWGKASDYVSVGDEIIYYQLETITNEDGSKEDVFKQKGVFYAQKPTQKSKNLFEVIAYDNITKLDVDLTEWLSNEEEFKAQVGTIGDLINAVATKCGVTINTDKVDLTLLNTGISWLGKVSLTGRQIISNIAQLLCKFLITDEFGNIIFNWYSESETEIVPSGDKVTSVSYKQGGLSAENYEVETVTGVALINSDTNVKYTYGETVGNTVNISNNIIFNAIENASDINNILLAIYNGFRSLPINFKPCSVQLFSSDLIKVGTYIKVTDTDNVSFMTLIMKTTLSGGGLFVSSTSEQNYNNYSSTAIDNSGNATVDGKKITSISADKIKTGRVESNDGETYFDLDDGIIETVKKTYIGENETGSETATFNSGRVVFKKDYNASNSDNFSSVVNFGSGSTGDLGGAVSITVADNRPNTNYLKFLLGIVLDFKAEKRREILNYMGLIIENYDNTGDSAVLNENSLWFSNGTEYSSTGAKINGDLTIKVEEEDTSLGTALLSIGDILTNKRTLIYETSYTNDSTQTKDFSIKLSPGINRITISWRRGVAVYNVNCRSDANADVYLMSQSQSVQSINSNSYNNAIPTLTATSYSDYVLGFTINTNSTSAYVVYLAVENVEGFGG